MVGNPDTITVGNPYIIMVSNPDTIMVGNLNSIEVCTFILLSITQRLEVLLFTSFYSHK